MTEIEEKEKMLKLAVEENNKYLEAEGKMELPSGEISSQAAAYKFSSMRGNAFKLPTGVNTELPTEKIIEEVPEEEDEETFKLDEMIQEAQNFNENFAAVESCGKIYTENLKSLDFMEDEGDNIEYSESQLKEEEDENTPAE